MKVLIVSLPIFLLAGCSGIRDTFGLNHQRPNELHTEDPVDLSIPKNWELRPPKTGGESSPNARPSPSSSARELIGEPISSPDNTESILTKKGEKAS